MTPDWTRLSAHRPLEPGDRAYVGRADDVRLVGRVLAGQDVVLVCGPVGIGLSTELAQAAHRLAAHRPAALVALGRPLNLRTLTGQEVRAVVERAMEKARRQGGKPCLLIDGVEKASPAAATEAFDALRTFVPHASLIVAVPWRAMYGPEADEVLAADEKRVFLRPMDVSHADAPGTRFLRELAMTRLDLPTVPEDLDSVLVECARSSGGVPRAFLQLLADAATWARLTRGARWPALDDVALAVERHRDSFRRLLVPGDDQALQALDGTDGRELDLARKVRLLAHGMLLEREEGGRVVMRVHPLVAGSSARRMPITHTT